MIILENKTILNTAKDKIKVLFIRIRSYNKGDKNTIVEDINIIRYLFIKIFIFLSGKLKNKDTIWDKKIPDNIRHIYSKPYSPKSNGAV